jgi:hypothetical protein
LTPLAYSKAEHGPARGMSVGRLSFGPKYAR